MKRPLMAVTVSALFVLGLAVSACGSSDGGGGSEEDCQKVCAKVGECGSAEDEQACLGDCPDMTEVIRASAWNYATDCILNMPCDDNFNPDACLLEAAQQEPESNVDGLANSACNKTKECDDTVDVNQCVTEFKTDDDMIILRIISDDALNCVGSCVTGKSCDEIGDDMDTVFAQCACGCGLPFCE